MRVVKQQVESLMKRNKIYRNDDKRLVLRIWATNGLVLTPEQREAFFSVPSADVILRRRRELSYKYPAEPEVMEKRYGHFTEFKEEFSRMNYPKLPVEKTKRRFLARWRRGNA